MIENLFRFDASKAYQSANLSGDGSATHWDLGQAGTGVGHLNSYLTPSTLISVADIRLHRALTHRMQAVTDLLLVRAVVSSECDYHAVGESAWEFRRPEVTVSTIPAGTAFDVSIGAGTHQCGVTVFIKPRALFEHHGVVSEDLPPPLRHFIESGNKVPAIEVTLPMRPEIASLIDDLRLSRLTRGLRRMQIEGRAAELLALVATTWNSRLSTDDSHGLRGRDAELLASARRILMTRCTQPPRLQELASELGTNRTKLNELFRTCIGVTPQEYAMQRRIERAQALIAEGKLNVGQIADEVGYQHQSSFTTAFRDVTGMSPRQYSAQVRTRSTKALAHH